MHGEFPVTTILSELIRDDLLPAILFRSARKQCDNDLLRLERAKNLTLSVDEQLILRDEIQKVIDKYKVDTQVIFEHPHYNALVHTGAGAHHAGQLLIWRLLLEELMSRGLLRLLIATGTVAAGVDFPARCAIITAHSRRGSEGFRVLSSTEFQQMSGRAGRRGKDAVGFCLVAPSPFSDARLIAEVARKPPEPLRSAYFASPSTVLNILRYRNVDDMRYTVSKSLAAFLDRKAAMKLREEAIGEQSEGATHKTETQRKKFEKRIRRLMKQAEELESHQMTLLEKSLDGLQKLGHIENGKLTPKGHWAANLCTSLVLELAEAIDSGLLTDLSVVELVAVVASIAGDPHKVYLSIAKNPIRAELFEKMKEILEKVGNAYERPPSSSDVGVVPNAALTAITWMEARDWSEFSGYLRLGGVAEGDVARLISQTGDHLNQLCRLNETHPVLAASAEEARGRILRPPLSEVLATAGQNTPAAI